MANKWLSRHYQLLLLLLVLLLAAGLRLVSLTITPPGLYLDEVSIAYNAWSIAETGKDEYGKAWPRLLEAYGEYKQPVYIYATAIWIWLGVDPVVAVRLTSAVAGIVTVAAVYVLALQLSKKLPRLPGKWFPLLSAVALAIMPWHIHFSRAGFEAVLALALLATSLAVLMSGNRWYHLSLGLSLAVISMATYNASRVVAPVWIALLLLWLRPQLSRWQWIASLIVPLGFCLLLWPALFSTQSLSRFEQTSTFSGQSFGSGFGSVISGVVAHLDSTFLFFRGDQDGRHSVRHLGMLLPSDILIGIIALSWLTWRPRLLFGFGVALAVAILPAALTTPVPHGLRSLFSVLVFALILGIGYSRILDSVPKRLSWSHLKLLGVVVVVGFYLTYYLGEYHFRYRRITALDWSDGIQETVSVVSSRDQFYDRIYITPGITPIELALYLPIPPGDFQKLPRDTKVFQYGPIRYVDIAWMAEIVPGKPTLVVAPASQVAEFPPLETIKLANDDAFMALWERK